MFDCIALIQSMFLLHGYEVRIVGGFVRDTLMTRVTQDIDLCTNATPDKIIEVFRLNNIKYTLIGVEHGTINAIINSYDIQITTLRKDICCDGRHAKVIFTENWFEDAARRDFTINAMYFDNKLQLYDYFEGKNDLKNGIIRFIGNPKQRVDEDYLRILRYFRFLGYFDDDNSIQIDNASYNAVINMLNKLKYLSKERITNELIKILKNRNIHTSLYHIMNNDVFSALNIPIKKIDISKLFFINDAIINLAAICKISSITNILDISVSMIFTKLQYKLIDILIRSNMYDHFYKIFFCMKNNIDCMNDIYKQMYFFSKDIYLKLFQMYFVLCIKQITSENIYNKFYNAIYDITLKVFPINGNDLKRYEYNHKNIGNALKDLKKIWINNDCNLTKTELLNMYFTTSKEE